MDQQHSGENIGGSFDGAAGAELGADLGESRFHVITGFERFQKIADLGGDGARREVASNQLGYHAAACH